MTLPPVVDVVEAALREGVAPAVASTVLVGGAVVHAAASGDAQRTPTRRALADGDLFDLASVTKPYVGSVVARLVDRGVLDLDDAVSRWLPGFRSGGKEAVTVRHLLAHASGLPAWRPLFERAGADPVARTAFAAPARRPGPAALVAAFRRGRELAEEAVSAEPLEAAPGTRAAYSDLGFIALGLVVERICGVPLDAAVEAEVTAPLSLRTTTFLPGLDPARAAARRAGRTFVPTRRSAARAGEVVCGTADDDNAWMMGGVAGHAGLFATAADVAAFGQAWLDALAGRTRWLSPTTAALFAARDATPGSERALGWDTPSREGSALGTRLGRGPRGAIGHLGFTGTSLWLDRDRELACALLTNHVHPDGSDRERIRAFRARFHDAVADARSG